MTVVSSIQRNDYTGTGTTGPFAYGFRIFAATDLRVLIADLSGTETTLSYPAQYTVSGVGVGTGGAVTLATALTSGYALSIQRNVPITQARSVRNQGPFFAATLEDALDQLTMIDQQQQDGIDRSFKLPSTLSAAAASTEINPFTPSAYLRVRADGLGIESVADVVASQNFLQSGAGAVTRSANSKMADWVSLRDFDDSAGGGVADDRATVVRANAAFPSGGVVVPPGTYRIASNLTISNAIEFMPGAILKPDNGVTVTIAGAFTAPPRQVFDLTSGGLVSLGAGAAVSALLPQWWGALANGAHDDTGALNAAIAAASLAGGKVLLPAGCYKYSTLTFTSAVGVRFEGAARYGTSLLTSNLTTDTVTLTDCTLVEMRNLEFYSTGQRTGGAMVKLSHVLTSTFENIRMQSPFIGFDVAGGSGASLNFTNIAMVPQNGAWAWSNGFRFQSSAGVNLSNCSVNFATCTMTRAACEIDSGCDSVYAVNCSFSQVGGTPGGATGGLALWVHHSLSPSSFAPRWTKLVSCAFESGSTFAIEIDDCNNIEFHAGYALTSKSAVSILGGTNIKFFGGQYGNASEHGIVVQAGNNVLFDGATVTAASLSANNTYSAILITGTATNVTVINCPLGDTTTIPGTATTMAFGVNVQATATDVLVGDGNTFGPLITTPINQNSIQSQYRPKRVTWEAAQPASGTWRVGDVVYNLTPVAGGFVGWVCTAAGTPGTWKTFGAISP